LHPLGLQLLAQFFAEGEEGSCGGGFTTAAPTGHAEGKFLLLWLLHAS
jgi:hypothetical protein